MSIKLIPTASLQQGHLYSTCIVREKRINSNDTLFTNGAYLPYFGVPSVGPSSVRPSICLLQLFLPPRAQTGKKRHQQVQRYTGFIMKMAIFVKVLRSRVMSWKPSQQAKMLLDLEAFSEEISASTGTGKEVAGLKKKKNMMMMMTRKSWNGMWENFHVDDWRCVWGLWEHV